MLANSTSPYLLQHKDNPVHWMPWNSNTLKHAQKLGKPILLSIGYAACHWCHVMAHESFEDQQVASIMNDLFICIKVDREERPDIDHIYMTALHQLGEQGGWPLTMFLTPDGRPVWGGTYFPKESKWGRPGFVDVLREISRIFKEEPDKIDQSQAAIMTRLEMRHSVRKKLTPDLLHRAANRLYELMDHKNGGTRGAPKFPQCPLLHFLWHSAQTRSDSSLTDIVMLTLERICQGGIYDHLGGGFSRYSVDEHWLVPHFEKMLYDNAQLLDLLCLAYKHSGNELFLERINETVNWMEQEMLTDQGAFSSSLDADTDGEEGKFYVWNQNEIENLLANENINLFKSIYDVQPEGNWEGKTILNRLKSVGTSFDEDSQRLTNEKFILFNARNSRTRPGCDDKILADWNGLAIASIARLSSFGINSDSNFQLAKNAFKFVTSKMTVNGELGHSWRNKKLLFPGQLSDYASIIHASLALYEVRFNQKYIQFAENLVEIVCNKFHDDSLGGFFMTTSDSDDLILRPKYSYDDPTPNANGLLCQELVRLYHQTGKSKFKNLYEEILEVFSTEILQNVFGSASLLTAFHFSQYPILVVLVGPEGQNRDSMLSVVRKQANPNIIPFVSSTTEALPDNHPAKNKTEIHGKPTAYVCTANTCLEPVVNSRDLNESLTSVY